LVSVRAISINPVDVRTRAGSAMAEHLKQYLPLILGWDIAGVVTEVGSEVSKFKLGDEVFGLVNFLGQGKAYAEYVAAPAHHLSLKPANVSFGNAAAATLAALTAWQLLKNYAGLQPGDRVLIQAASGGVGHYAVQIAKYLGAFVIGISSSKNKAFVMQLGADEHIAYDEETFEDVVNNIDVVVDAFAFDSLYKSLKVLKPGGKLISLLPMISPDLLEKAERKNVDVHYSLVSSNGVDMEAISSMMADGTLKSHVSKLFPFEMMREAHHAMETGKTVGKIVLTV